MNLDKCENLVGFNFQPKNQCEGQIYAILQTFLISPHFPCNSEKENPKNSKLNS